MKRCDDKAGEGTFTFGKMPGRGNRRKPDDDDDESVHDDNDTVVGAFLSRSQFPAIMHLCQIFAKDKT